MPSCSFLSLLLLVVLDVVLLHCDGAVAAGRPLLGIAEPPSPPVGAAAGPAGASRPGGGGGRPDRSVAGADVILVGFAAAVMVVIFCYIRVTRKNKNSSSCSAGLGEKQHGVGAF